MKRFLVTMLDGTSYSVEARDYDAATDKAIIESLSIVRSWPMLPQEIHQAISPREIELIEV